MSELDKMVELAKEMEADSQAYYSERERWIQQHVEPALKPLYDAKVSSEKRLLEILEQFAPKGTVLIVTEKLYYSEDSEHWDFWYKVNEYREGSHRRNDRFKLQRFEYWPGDEMRIRVYGYFTDENHFPLVLGYRCTIHEFFEWVKRSRKVIEG